MACRAAISGEHVRKTDTRARRGRRVPPSGAAGDMAGVAWRSRRAESQDKGLGTVLSGQPPTGGGQ